MHARYRWGGRLSAAIAVLAIGVSGCSASGDATPTAPRTTPAQTSQSAAPTPSPNIDPATVRANELGVVPVLMYHQFLAEPKGSYDQTPAQLKAELTRLYREGYRTITAADLVAGTIDLPAGRSPMVLTFDDATTSQYGELPDGSPDPKSGLGILLAVAKTFGEERPVATFYVNEEPFAGRDDYLKKLHDLGMELGDHTRSHANLKRLSDAAAQAEIAQNLAYLRKQVPGVEVTTMALPLGLHPTNRALAAKGSSGGTSYDFKGVMLVGAGPAPSPFSATFKPLGIPRLLSGRDKSEPFAATYWLNRIRATRYISDGDPERLSFPKAAAAKLSPRFASIARPY